MSDQPTNNNTLPTYKPSELIAIFSAALGRQNEFAKLVSLRGIYQQRQNNPQWAYAYAGLRDESSQEEITLRIPKELYESLVDGNLITVGGIFVPMPLRNDSQGFKRMINNTIWANNPQGCYLELGGVF